jgi:transposase
VISIAVVAAIGTGEAFDRGRDFGAWLGLVPRQYSTGGRSVLGRISKRGSKYLRTLFIQAANVILMRPHNWQRFSFGTWLQNAAPAAPQQAGDGPGKQAGPDRLERPAQ